MIALGNGLLKTATVRWRFMFFACLCSLLGALLGFAGQFVVDMAHCVDTHHLSWTHAADIVVPSEIPPPVEDGPGYVWAYCPDGRRFGSPYLTKDGPVAKDFFPNESQKGKWRQLWYELLVCDWLQHKGQQASAVASCTALLGAWAAYALDRRRQKA
jgi:hypothetical protein